MIDRASLDPFESKDGPRTVFRNVLATLPFAFELFGADKRGAGTREWVDDQIVRLELVPIGGVPAPLVTDRIHLDYAEAEGLAGPAGKSRLSRAGGAVDDDAGTDSIRAHER